MPYNCGGSSAFHAASWRFLPDSRAPAEAHFVRLRGVARWSRPERCVRTRMRGAVFARLSSAGSVRMEETSTAAGSRPLSGRNAVVTGASRGVGRGIAVGLGEAGASLFITGRSPNQLEETSRLVREAGGKCDVFLCDHESDEEVQAFFGQVKTHLSTVGGGVSLDLLVNNAFAGAPYIAESRKIPLWNKSVVNPEVSDPNSPPGAYWDKINNVGLRSNYIATILALRMMIPAQTGCIINISSFGGTIPIFDAVYGAGKCANDRLASDIASSLIEPVDTGVRMLTLYPGIVSTEIILKAFESNVAAEEENKIAHHQSDESVLQFMWNAESPIYVGRVIASVAADSSRRARDRRNGKILIAAEAGQHYGIRDVNGEERYSLRSLRTFVLASVPFLRTHSLRFWIPDIYVPWFIVKLVTGPGLSR